MRKVYLMFVMLLACTAGFAQEPVEVSTETVFWADSTANNARMLNKSKFGDNWFFGMHVEASTLGVKTPQMPVSSVNSVRQQRFLWVNGSIRLVVSVSKLPSVATRVLPLMNKVTNGTL